MSDGYLSLKTTTPRWIRTNTPETIDIKGVTRFRAEIGGRQTLAMYLNLDLPKAGSSARRAMNRGGVRCWFQEPGKPVDVTGLDGPWPLPVWGDQHALISHTWPHTANTTTPWEFCFEVYAFNARGGKVSYPLQLETREIKIINDRR